MSIVLNSKTYNPIGYDQNAVSVFIEQSSGVPAGFSRLTDKVNAGNSKSDGSVKWKMTIPVIATEDSSCACSGEALRTYYVSIDVSVPSGSLKAERDDVLARITDLVATTQFASSISSLVQATT